MTGIEAGDVGGTGTQVADEYEGGGCVAASGRFVRRCQRPTFAWAVKLNPAMASVEPE